MHLAALLSLTVWFGDAEPPPQVAVDEVFASFDYQRDLLPQPGRFRPGGGGGGTDMARPPGQAGGDDAEEWTRDDWERQMARENRQFRSMPRELGPRTPRERRARPPPSSSSDSQGSSGGGDGLRSLFEILVYLAIGVAALTIIVSLIRNWGRKEATVKPKVSDGGEAARASLEAPRSEAEALADQGRYAEAVHVLLLKTIEALVTTQPGGVPEAWTSREIQLRAPMPEAARAPFGVLVDSVEQGLFGGRAVDEDAWARCLARFREFESAYRSPRT